MAAPRKERGLTLIECLAALALLGVVLTMSFTVLDRHRRQIERMDARLAATRAAESELETLLAGPPADLRPRRESPSRTRPPELAALAGSRMTHTIALTDVPSLLRVRVDVQWKADGGHAVTVEALIHQAGRAADPEGRP